MDPGQFEDRMKRLVKSRRPVLALDDAVSLLEAGNLPEGAVVITVDDGWSSTYSHMLPVLEGLGLPATLYVTTWYVENALPIANKLVDYLLFASAIRSFQWGGVDHSWSTDGQREHAALAIARAIDDLPVNQRLATLETLSHSLGVDPAVWLETRQFHLMTPKEISDAASRGMDIQLHTHRHVNVAKRFGDLPEEISRNRACLEKYLGLEDGTALRHFCYPSGNYPPEADTLLKSLGIRSATLVDQGLNGAGSSPFQLKRFLDGRSVSQQEFDAYLDGVLHFTDAASAVVRKSRRHLNQRL